MSRLTESRSIRKALGVFMLLAGLGVSSGVVVVEAQGPVKIGFIYNDSGPFAQSGLDMRDGFLLYWSEVGQKAGGRAVELVLENKGSLRPDEALTKARKLVERDGVHLLSGIVEAADSDALRPYVIDKKIPLMITTSGALGITQRQRGEYIFRSSFASSDGSHPLGDWAYKHGYRKAVILASDFAGAHEMIGPFARTFTDLGGRVIQELYPPGGAADFAPYLAQIKRDADVVVPVFFGVDALRFVNQYAEFGLREKIPVIGRGYLTDETFLTKMGDNALGIVTSHQWSAALDTPLNRRFLEAHTSKYGRPATANAEGAYVGAQMIARALDAVKGNVENKEAFMAALRKVEVDAPKGKVRLDTFQNVVHTIYMRRVEKRDGVLRNAIIGAYPDIGQFWTWTPEEYLAMTPYPEIKGKWAK